LAEGLAILSLDGILYILPGKHHGRTLKYAENNSTWFLAYNQLSVSYLI
jgi:hypothetical protein